MFISIALVKVLLLFPHIAYGLFNAPVRIFLHYLILVVLA